MKKYKIRFFGFGITGTTEMYFNTEPTIEMIEDLLALHMNKGIAEIEQDKFYSNNRFTITKSTYSDCLLYLDDDRSFYCNKIILSFQN